MTLPVSKPAGIVWLLAFLMFLSAFVQFLLNNAHWWLTASTGILASQILIIMYWRDTKFGTLPNFLILIVLILLMRSKF